MKCKLCGTEIPADDTDTEKAAATCASCQATVGAAGEPDATSALHRSGPARPPVGLLMDRQGVVLDIPWPVSSIGRWIVFVASVALPAGLAVRAFAVGWPPSGLQLAFGLVCLVVAVTVGYRGLAGVLSRTHLVITSDQVKVQTRGPMRRSPDLVIPIDAIDQLFCSGGSGDGPDGATYSVSAMQKGGRKRTLLSAVLSAVLKRGSEITLISGLYHDQALYLERELEKRMGIADRAVFGETPRERPRSRGKPDSSAPSSSLVMPRPADAVQRPAPEGDLGRILREDPSVQIHCRSCGSEIAADDMNLERAIAKCAACNDVFGFSDPLEAGGNERPPVPMPRNTRVEREGADLVITWRWFKLLYLAAVVFAIVWNAGVMGLWRTALSPGTSLVGRLSVLPFVAAGAFVAYVALTGLLNSTRLTANSDALTVRHGPIPAPGGRTIPTSDIEQLFCTERVRRSRNANAVTTYRVRVTLKDRRTRTLLWALDDFDRALFIEEQIERHLGIEDRHVRGSMRG
ncbi:hypothetical protein CMK11_06360 [Candidatus Poribacteria bacterium]|nr:hypothetical protein [Candidatus Poribacteria bacterium]